MVRRDPNPTRPDGSANPYLGGHYVELTWSDPRNHDLIYDGRFDAMPEWKPVRWMVPRLYATAGTTIGRNHSAVANLVRTNDPSSANFNAAQNTIHRRIFFMAGDNTKNRGLGVPANAGTRGITAAVMPTGGKRRLWSESTCEGISSTATYWDGVLRTNLGLRRDAASNDIQSGVRHANSGLNDVTNPRRNVNQVQKYSPTIGGTLRPIAPLTFFGNFAQTFRAPGTTATIPLGDSVTIRKGEGKEAGLRPKLLDGRFVSPPAPTTSRRAARTIASPPYPRSLMAFRPIPSSTASTRPTRTKSSTAGPTKARPPMPPAMKSNGSPI